MIAALTENYRNLNMLSNMYVSQYVSANREFSGEPAPLMNASIALKEGSTGSEISFEQRH